MILEDTEGFGKMIIADDAAFTKETVSSRLDSLMKKHDKKPSELIRKSLLSKSYVYQIIGGVRKPSREALIRLGIVCECDVFELLELLMLSGEGTLYPRIRRDAAILFCVIRKMNLYETDEFLTSIGENGIF